jgi:5-methylcytosine-specific restriction endonuclease McrA
MNFININEDKKINISGTANRYQIKKLTKEKKSHELLKNKSYDEHIYDDQINLIHNLKNNLIKTHLFQDAFSSINKKISSYKQQDLIKNVYMIDDFVNFDFVINLLENNNLKCCYCSTDIYILYEFVRDNKQWTLDRIDNDKGHNKDNVVIACLECNLKRRKTNKDAFMFTKQLKIILFTILLFFD